MRMRFGFGSVPLTLLFALAALAAAKAVAADPPSAAQVDVQIVKYKALGEMIKERKGKIIVVAAVEIAQAIHPLTDTGGILGSDHAFERVRRFGAHPSHQGIVTQHFTRTPDGAVDRQAHGDLMLPGRGACEQEVRYIGARDQQNDPNHNQQRDAGISSAMGSVRLDLQVVCLD